MAIYADEPRKLSDEFEDECDEKEECSYDEVSEESEPEKLNLTKMLVSYRV